MNSKILIVSTACLALTGCFGGNTSPQSRFYGLTTPYVASQTRGPATITNIAIDTVSVPQLVARPQMVVRHNDSTEITLAEFDRWIENLDAALPVVISENMNMYAKNISARPSRIGTRKAAKYNVSVEFVRFDTVENGDITMAAWWLITNDRGDVIAQKKNTFTAPTPHDASGAPDYDAIVATQSKLIAKLSYKIADTISGLK